jgi:hypothetical protein
MALVSSTEGGSPMQRRRALALAGASTLVLGSGVVASAVIAAPLGPAPTTNVTPRRPRGVPEDWPAGKPVPPMPPNCHEPQLEDNGVWNCQQANHG